MTGPCSGYGVFAGGIVGPLSTLSFAIVGDTRPPTEDDTAGDPTAIITKIWQDVEAASPRPAFSNPMFPTMGNHECDGATADNCYACGSTCSCVGGSCVGNFCETPNLHRSLTATPGPRALTQRAHARSAWRATHCPSMRRPRLSTAARLWRNALGALLYVAKITRVAARFRAEFPDIGDWSALAATEDEVVAEAKRALSELLRRQIAAGRRVSQRRYRGPGPAIEVDGKIALAIQLREARTEACLSTTELGERARVGRQVVEDLEAGSGDATLDKVIPIARVLGARPVIEPERPGEAVGLTKGKPRGW